MELPVLPNPRLANQWTEQMHEHEYHTGTRVSLLGTERLFKLDIGTRKCVFVHSYHKNHRRTELIAPLEFWKNSEDETVDAVTQAWEHGATFASVLREQYTLALQARDKQDVSSEHGYLHRTASDVLMGLLTEKSQDFIVAFFTAALQFTGRVSYVLEHMAAAALKTPPLLAWRYLPEARNFKMRVPPELSTEYTHPPPAPAEGNRPVRRAAKKAKLGDPGDDPETEDPQKLDDLQKLERYLSTPMGYIDAGRFKVFTEIVRQAAIAAFLAFSMEDGARDLVLRKDAEDAFAFKHVQLGGKRGTYPFVVSDEFLENQKEGATVQLSALISSREPKDGRNRPAVPVPLGFDLTKANPDYNLSLFSGPVERIDGETPEATWERIKESLFLERMLGAHPRDSILARRGVGEYVTGVDGNVSQFDPDVKRVRALVGPLGKLRSLYLRERRDGQLEGISFTSWIEQTLDGRELAPFMLFPSCAAPLVMFYDDHLPKSPPAPFAPNPSLHPILADSLSHLTTLVSSRKGTYYRNPLRVSPSKKMPVALGAKSSESVGDALEELLSTAPSDFDSASVPPVDPSLLPLAAALFHAAAARGLDGEALVCFEDPATGARYAAVFVNNSPAPNSLPPFPSPGTNPPSVGPGTPFFGGPLPFGWGPGGLPIWQAYWASGGGGVWAYIAAVLAQGMQIISLIPIAAANQVFLLFYDPANADVYPVYFQLAQGNDSHLNVEYLQTALFVERLSEYVKTKGGLQTGAHHNRFTDLFSLFPMSTLESLLSEFERYLTAVEHRLGCISVIKQIIPSSKDIRKKMDPVDILWIEAVVDEAKRELRRLQPGRIASSDAPVFHAALAIWADRGIPFALAYLDRLERKDPGRDSLTPGQRALLDVIVATCKKELAVEDLQAGGIPRFFCDPTGLRLSTLEAVQYVASRCIRDHSAPAPVSVGDDADEDAPVSVDDDADEEHRQRGGRTLSLNSAGLAILMNKIMESRGKDVSTGRPMVFSPSNGGFRLAGVSHLQPTNIRPVEDDMSAFRLEFLGINGLRADFPPELVTMLLDLSALSSPMAYHLYNLKGLGTRYFPGFVPRSELTPVGWMEAVLEVAGIKKV